MVLVSGLICPEDIVPEVGWFVQMQFSEPQLCLHGNPSKQTESVQSSSCAVMDSVWGLMVLPTRVWRFGIVEAVIVCLRLYLTETQIP